MTPATQRAKEFGILLDKVTMQAVINPDNVGIHIAALFALVEQTTQELTAATERAERAEKELARFRAVSALYDSVARWDAQVRRNEELKRELTTCRAALDKTRLEADKWMDRAVMADRVVEAVRHLQKEIPHIQGGDEATRQRRWEWQEKRNALMSMPLPPETEKTP